MLQRKRAAWVAALVATAVGGACGSEATTTDSEGCDESSDCAADERCDFADDRCGSGERGVCVDKPNGCSTGAGPYPWICGCDGAFHTSECIDHDGVDTSADVSICPDQPPGTFACGTSWCHSGFDYCLVQGGGESCQPGGFDCSTCDCLTAAPCTDPSCSDDGGVVVVTCP